MPTRSKAFVITDDGLIVESGVWITSGSAAPTHSAEDGDRHFQLNGTAWRYMDGWSRVGEGDTVSGGSVSLNGISSSELNAAQTSYKVLAKLIFRGTDLAGAPDSIKILARTSAASGDIKFFDATNEKTIAEKNFTNSTDAVIDMGTLSNLPTGEAVIEIQGKKTGGGSVFISAAVLGF